MLQASNWPSFQIAIAFSLSLFWFCNIVTVTVVMIGSHHSLKWESNLKKELG
jgi:ribulose 1,5-bisphosphate carboxylase large subunit-like protein